MLHTDIDCPNCHTVIHVPFMRGLEAKAIEDFDMVEIPAQDKLKAQTRWLYSASLWQFIKFWFARKGFIKWHNREVG